MQLLLLNTKNFILNVQVVISCVSNQLYKSTRKIFMAKKRRRAIRNRKLKRTSFCRCNSIYTRHIIVDLDLMVSCHQMHQELKHPKSWKLGSQQERKTGLVKPTWKERYRKNYCFYACVILFPNTNTYIGTRGCRKGSKRRTTQQKT